jgi:hypothetical protein
MERREFFAGGFCSILGALAARFYPKQPKQKPAPIYPVQSQTLTVTDGSTVWVNMHPTGQWTHANGGGWVDLAASARSRIGGDTSYMLPD